MIVLGKRYRGGVYLSGNINPTEIVKPLLVFFLARYLSQRQQDFSETLSGIPVPPFSSFLGLVLLWSVPMGLTILLRDLGLVILLNTILIVMLFAVAKRLGYLAIGLAGVAAAGFAMQFISSNAQARFDIWLNPFMDPTGKGWQILQGLTAMYSGGWWGSGIGVGSPETVPIVTSDFVYAAFAEEVGFVGCVFLLLIYATFYSRGFRAAGATHTPFERLLCVGLTASLAMQTLLNVAGVTKALPMTGITLPFISHGGSSLIICLLIAGLMCGLSDND
jgi:cell division protein FtsW (lipid II flippase)